MFEILAVDAELGGEMASLVHDSEALRLGPGADPADVVDRTVEQIGEKRRDLVDGETSDWSRLGDRTADARNTDLPLPEVVGKEGGRTEFDVDLGPDDRVDCGPDDHVGDGAAQPR